MPLEPVFLTLTFFAFAVGAVVGSFLNVVIYRVPAGESIVTPGSRCPECDADIRWYDNIPVISWFVLDGTCRQCDASISARYPLVEGVMGFLSAALWLKVASPHTETIVAGPFADTAMWGSIALAFVLYFVFLALLVVITFVDLDHYLIPHQFTLPGIALGIIAAFLLNSGLFMADGSMAHFWPPVTLTNALIGAIVGALAVLVLFYLYFAARGVAGLGGGDLTMMALVGAWLGWPALIFVFFAASIQGLIAAAFGALFGAGFLKDSSEILAQQDPRDVARRKAETDGSLDRDDDEDEIDLENDLAGELDLEDDDESEIDDEHEDEVEHETDHESEVDLDGELDLEDDEDEIEADHESENDLDTDSEIEVDNEHESEIESDNETEHEDEPESEGGLAVPFGPFIALSAAQYFFVGEFLPSWISMDYIYTGF